MCGSVQLAYTPNNSFESFATLTGTGRLRRPAPQLKRWASRIVNGFKNTTGERCGKNYCNFDFVVLVNVWVCAGIGG